MGHKQVLLREDIDNLGARGEIVRVKAGYARNYLLPRSLAVEATNSNVKQIEGERAALMKREAKERAGAEGQADQLRNLNLKFERKVGEAGVLYGSVTSMDIAAALKEQGYEIDRRKIVLRELKETLFRLRVLRNTGILTPAHDPVITECTELVKIVATLIRGS